MPSSRRSVAVALGLGLAASALTFTPASANPGGTGLVISEAYGGGGNSGATVNADFVELYNPTSAPLSLEGLSLQARAASGGSAGSLLPLSGDVAAGSHYLVQTSAAGSNGTALPTPDATASWTLGGTGAQVLLVQGTATFADTGNLAGNAGLVDMVGWGTTSSGTPAASFETARAGTTSNNTAVTRNATGGDTDDNSADFTVVAPDPQSSGVEPPPPTEVDATIAEVQGTDTGTSPHAGDTVTTQGVVTAAYPDGGFNGFYIQTEGTGGATDATPGASDGIFVFGGSTFTAYPEVGEFVEVTGAVSEFGTAPNTLTEITVDDAGVTAAAGSADPVTPLAAAYPTTTADREAHEGEVFAPTNQFTVTNTFNMNNFAEIGLATGNTPLIAPTEVADAQDTAAVQAVAADNAARGVALDDGASTNYLSGDNQDIPLPWLSTTNPVRVGATATLHAPVVLDWRNNVWKFQPTQRVTGDGASVATFENTRPANANPQDVGGDIRLATFNVLNYFPTTGQEFVGLAPGNTCTFFNDRDGNPIANNACNPNGPRGAANAANLARQQSKIVTAINRLDASIVSLEELENSAKFGKSRDFAITQLVRALNTDAGPGTWSFAPTPPQADRPTVAQEDVIRTGFIYKPADVRLVGDSRILVDEENFDNAREPLAQAFKAAGTSDDEAFSVVVNHFKSKGSGADDGTGQGLSNPDRIGQANALVGFANQFAADRGTEAVFLAGDLNSYSQEDPMQVLYGADYDAIESDTAGEETYSFSGLSGSLDHVLGNAAAMAMVTGADVWNINSPESVAFQYSRFNYNVTQFFEGTLPFAASDHDPEIVGLNLPDATTTDVQILGTNDFHGRLANNSSGTEAGAAVLAGAVKELRGNNPNTVFAAAGDLIGASTFESFIQDDKPTIDALNEAGLEVSAVGNHEFDKGYDDLVNRVMAQYDAESNPRGGAEWKYLGANVKFKADGSDALDGTWIKEMNGVQVGFVGTVTEHLPELVSPGGISEIEVTDIVDATNEAADDLKAEGADVVVMLVHEGAGGTNCAAMDDDPNSDFGSIITGVNENVDAIVSGHTHLAYDCSFTVPEWVTEGRAVTQRPVVSAGQYGSNLNRLVFTVDNATGEVQAKTQQLLALKTGQTANYPSDPATAKIVQDAVTAAGPLGARQLGQIAGAFDKARFQGGADNRGGESTLGNLVAEVQRWATETEEAGSAQIAFMNPGGLRADMRGTIADGYPETLTYRQAADVQPFANTLVNMQLTGADIEQVLKQQWQSNPGGSTPSRPFLRLGASKGFTYTYDPPAAGSPAGTPGDITGMWLNGVPINPTTSYSVTVNSFLATGGDNFRAFRNGTAVRDTGKIDLQAMVDYMAEFANPDQGDQPLPVDFHQHAVGVEFPADAPGSYAAGDTVAFDVSSWSMTGPTDVRDDELEVSLGSESLGTFPVTTTLSPPADANSNDEAGRSSVSFALPAGTPAGEQVLTLTGASTGTTTEVPITVEATAPVESTTTATAPAQVRVGGGATDIEVTVSSAPGAPTPTGEVVVSNAGGELVRATLVAGQATVPVGPFGTVGTKEFTVSYSGDEVTAPSESPVSIEVIKRNASIAVDREPRRVVAGETRTVLTVDVSTGGGITPTGRVEVRRGGEVLQAGRLDAGSVRLRLPVFGKAGEKTVKVAYLGDGKVLAETVDYTFTVQSR